MENKTTYVLLTVIFLLVLGLLIFFSSVRKPEVVSSPEPKPITVAVTAPVKTRKEIVVKKSVKTMPSTMILERKTWEGNKGYIIRDGEYVYFGVYRIVREEVPVR